MGGSAGKLYKAIKDPSDAKKLKASFDAYDADKSGVLDQEELRKFGQDCIKFLKKDLKKEQFLVRLMVKGTMMLLNEDEFVEWCISEADTNGNGEVDWDEFCTFVKTHDSWEKFQIVEGLDMKATSDATLKAIFTGDDSDLNAIIENHGNDNNEEPEDFSIQVMQSQLAPGQIGVWDFRGAEHGPLPHHIYHNIAPGQTIAHLFEVVQSRMEQAPEMCAFYTVTGRLIEATEELSYFEGTVIVCK